MPRVQYMQADPDNRDDPAKKRNQHTDEDDDRDALCPAGFRLCRRLLRQTFLHDNNEQDLQ